MEVQEKFVTEGIADNEIIARILKGEKELYAVMVRRYNQKLYRIGMALVNDDAEVEDIMQVVYISAYENLGKFGFRSTFSTWLTRILINESFLRLKRRGKLVNMNEYSMEREMNQQSIESRTPATQLQNTELKWVLQQAIQRLPEKYRVVFIMREIEGMNVSETKECLDISEVNVKVRLNRAKVLLRNTLNNYYNKEDILSFHLSRCNRMVNVVMKEIERL